MAISTDVPIYTTTLGAVSSVTIDLSSYQMYKNLKIVMNAQRGITGSGGAGPSIIFNSDSGSNYSSTLLYEGSPYTTRLTNSSNLGYIGSAGDGNLVLNTIYVNNYSNTAMHKTVISRYGSAIDGTARAAVGTWRNTAAVTSITMTPPNGIAAGSTFSVYGIGSATTGAKATGGAIYSDADYFYHVFGSTAAFVPSQNLTADYMIVGGGGGGGFGGPGGSGGGGGVVSIINNASLTSGTSYTATVGAGGAADSGNGVASSFNSLTSNGGTGGVGSHVGNGGSSGSYIDGTTLSYTGGAIYAGDNQHLAGGGGAGAGMNGKNGNDSTYGPKGGDGITDTIGNFLGYVTYFGGGGNGGTEGTGTNGGWGPYLGVTPSSKPLGGGGWGGGQYPTSNPASKPTAGSPNTGGGGGGGTWDNSLPIVSGAGNGATGGSGIVIVRYAR